ncbi:unnamed protein product [Pleuronectes platessa]|uniref:Uncharacterized protein n=1 Tax=Pleuronectes platessa TaxID=8262 RepID=A0A9N7ZAE0_PLEPL|nr:unnamed protein product [Pleuronectes platessa]
MTPRHPTAATSVSPECSTGIRHEDITGARRGNESNIRPHFLPHSARLPVPSPSLSPCLHLPRAAHLPTSRHLSVQPSSPPRLPSLGSPAAVPQKADMSRLRGVVQCGAMGSASAAQTEPALNTCSSSPPLHRHTLSPSTRVTFRDDWRMWRQMERGLMTPDAESASARPRLAGHQHHRGFVRHMAESERFLSAVCSQLSRLPGFYGSSVWERLTPQWNKGPETGLCTELELIKWDLHSFQFTLTEPEADLHSRLHTNDRLPSRGARVSGVKFTSRHGHGALQGLWRLESIQYFEMECVTGWIGWRTSARDPQLWRGATTVYHPAPAFNLSSFPQTPHRQMPPEADDFMRNMDPVSDWSLCPSLNISYHPCNFDTEEKSESPSPPVESDGSHTETMLISSHRPRGGFIHSPPHECPGSSASVGKSFRGTPQGYGASKNSEIWT